jgi:hypothetical protein
MEQRAYAIVKMSDQWIILVGDTKFFTCRNRRTALSTARHAEALLRGHSNQPPALARAQSRREDGTQRLKT